MTRALVTGSTGYVGANLVAALNERGIDVVGLQRKTSPQDAVQDLTMTPVVGDIMNPDSLQAAMRDVDWVFHVAAVADYWRVPDSLVYQVNVGGAKNVMQAALDAGVGRFVFTGSTAALGTPTRDKPLMDEQNIFNMSPKLFPYGHSKHLAEEALQAFVEKGLPAVSVMPAAVSGPRDLKFNVGELIRQAHKSGPLPTPSGGLNYIDSRDVADGHIAAAERGRIGERYILGGDNLTHRDTFQQTLDVVGNERMFVSVPDWLIPTVGVCVDMVQKLGGNLPVDKGRILLSREYMYYDTSKAVSELGLTTRSFAESIRDTYQWYIENGYLTARSI